MKKTILLAGIIASMTTMANVTGFVEANAKGDVTFTKEGKETKVTGNIDELSVKGEVKVNKLTLGAVLKNKDIKEISKVKPLTSEMYTENLLDNSSVYAKYELPEFAGIKSYVKGTLNPKAKYEADGTLNFKKGNVELEGQLAHSFSNGAEVSLTSKTTFPFEKKDGEYGKGVESEHVLKLGAKKLNKFEDLEASLKLNHTYAKEEAFKFVDLSAKGTYAGLKDTKLTGKASFRYQVNGTSDVKDLLTDGQIKLNKDAYAHSYELDGKYTGVKDLELTAGAFVQHVHYANAGYENYAPNPLESLYAENLVEYDWNLKKDIEDAKKALKNISSDDIEEYNKLKGYFDQAVKLAIDSLDENLKNAKEKFNNVDDAEKANAQEAYSKQVQVNDLYKKIDKIDSYLKELNGYKDGKYANTEYIESKEKELLKNQEDLTKEIDKLEEVLENANEKGKNLADAEYWKEIFDKEKYKYQGEPNDDDEENNEYDGDLFVVDENGKVRFATDDDEDDAKKTPYDLFNAYNSTKYGEALELLNDVKSYYKDLYDEKIKANKFFKAKLDLVNFGFKLGAKYTGVKNLTLTADGVFGGKYHSSYNQLYKYKAFTTGYVKLHAGAKYDFKLLNDKLVVIPEGNVTATFVNIYDGKCSPSLVLAPKVSVSYKPMDALKVAGSVEVPINFGLNTFGDFGYQSTSIKGALNMRYEWK
ncbi:hypothetical protein ABZU05_06000 [Sneathia vaginalis]|uniref:hypothetical protein n=1 Tax=Sneathia vaginalis TaxID=187101 RepID=UPI0035C6F4E5